MEGGGLDLDIEDFDIEIDGTDLDLRRWMQRARKGSIDGSDRRMRIERDGGEVFLELEKLFERGVGASELADELTAIEEALSEALRPALEGKDVDEDALEREIMGHVERAMKSRARKQRPSILFGPGGAPSGEDRGGFSSGASDAATADRTKQLRGAVERLKPTMNKHQRAIESLERDDSTEEKNKEMKKGAKKVF